jgi:hypothetical protein
MLVASVLPLLALGVLSIYLWITDKMPLRPNVITVVYVTLFIIYPIAFLLNLFIFEPRQRKLGKSRVAKESTIVITGAINDIFDKCYKALDVMGFAPVALERPKLIEAHKKDNLIKINCHTRAGKVSIFIQSDGLWTTTRIDFGLNRRNLERFERLIRTS